jgi:hypothetical protein
MILSEIAHLDALFSEKLARMDMRFELLEERTAEQKVDNAIRVSEQKKDMKDALNAALAAQKGEAASQTASLEKNIGKSETATIERIKSVETLLTTSSRSTDDKISDIKDRVIAIEAVKLGGIEQTANMRATGSEIRGNMGSIISVITTVIAVGSVLVAVFIATKH